MSNRRIKRTAHTRIPPLAGGEQQQQQQNAALGRPNVVAPRQHIVNEEEQNRRRRLAEVRDITVLNADGLLGQQNELEQWMVNDQQNWRRRTLLHLLFANVRLMRAEEEDQLLRNIDLLFNAGVDNVNAQDSEGTTCLSLAVRNRKLQAVRKLVTQHGADPNLADWDNKTPLYHCCANLPTPEDVEIADFMCSRAVETLVLDTVTKWGETPLIRCAALCYPRSLRIAECLLKRVEPAKRRAFVDQVAVADFLALRRKSVNQVVGDQFQTALHMATSVGNVQMIWLLDRHGANMDAENSEGRTPLFLATYAARYDVVEVLLELGADRFKMDIYETKILDLARQPGYEAIAELFQRIPEARQQQLQDRRRQLTVAMRQQQAAAAPATTSALGQGTSAAADKENNEQQTATSRELDRVIEKFPAEQRLPAAQQLVQQQQARLAHQQPTVPAAGFQIQQQHFHQPAGRPLLHQSQHHPSATAAHHQQQQSFSAVNQQQQMLASYSSSAAGNVQPPPSMPAASNINFSSLFCGGGDQTLQQLWPHGIHHGTSPFGTSPAQRQPVPTATAAFKYQQPQQLFQYRPGSQLLLPQTLQQHEQMPATALPRHFGDQLQSQQQQQHFYPQQQMMAGGIQPWGVPMPSQTVHSSGTSQLCSGGRQQQPMLQPLQHPQQYYNPSSAHQQQPQQQRFNTTFAAHQQSSSSHAAGTDTSAAAVNQQQRMHMNYSIQPRGVPPPSLVQSSNMCKRSSGGTSLYSGGRQQQPMLPQHFGTDTPSAQQQMFQQPPSQEQGQPQTQQQRFHAISTAYQQQQSSSGSSLFAAGTSAAAGQQQQLQEAASSANIVDADLLSASAELPPTTLTLDEMEQTYQVDLANESAAKRVKMVDKNSKQ